MPEVKRAAIYVRISQDREGAGLGVDRQREDCEALAARLGWPVVATYVDNDMSAYSGKPRPGYRELIADIDAGKVDAVLVWHTDRLHRSPRELEEFVDLCERHKIVTQTVKAGELDLSTPSGRAVARTLGAWARFEVEHKSERTKRAQLQAAQAGRWLGGAPPLGWRLRGDGSATLDRAAAHRIRKASADVLAGVSIGSIVTAWNEAGFLTGTGKAWNYTSLRQVLTRARNAGLIELNGEIVGGSTWPAIVSEDTWRALRATFADPTRRRSQSNRARWLLAGIAVCGKADCGAPLRSATATSANGRRVVYRCVRPGTGHVARSAVDVDQLVDRIMVERLRRHDVQQILTPSAPADDVAELRSERLALRARMTEVADEFADDDTISPLTLRRITRRLEDRLAEVDAALAARARTSALGGIADASDPAKAWRQTAIDRRRAIVRELLRVTVLPVPAGASMRAFDPELIEIDWL